MVPILNALAIATVLTASATLRYRLWTRVLTVPLYFLFFLALELVAHHYLPEIGMGIEVAYVCFSLSAALTAAGYFLYRHERRIEKT